MRRPGQIETIEDAIGYVLFWLIAAVLVLEPIVVVIGFITSR